MRCSAVFTATDTDAAVDPTTVTCSARAPGGTLSTPAVVKDSVGHYHALVTANEVGVWSYRFLGTGSNAGAGESQFEIDSSAFG